jgi:hypothetical protein
MQARSLRQALLDAWRPCDSALFWRYEALRGPLRGRVVLVVRQHRADGVIRAVWCQHILVCTAKRLRAARKRCISMLAGVGLSSGTETTNVALDYCQ